MNHMPICPLLILLTCVPIVAGCGTTLAPPTPAPQTISGMTRDRTSYTFLKWQGGLAVMLLDRCDVHSMSGSNVDGGWDFNGDAHWWDKDSNEWHNMYEWELETPNGQMGKLSINGVQYDLEVGKVFRIETKDGQATVQQLDRDLARVQPNRASCNNFVAADAELTKAVEEEGTE